MRKHMGWKVGAGAVLVAWPLSMALAQQTASIPAPAVMLSSPPMALHSNEIVRVIDDPHNGTRWYLLRDSTHPGGPGRMVPAAEYEQNEKQTPAPHFSAAAAAVLTPFHPCIRSGDHLIVEEHTPVMDAQLEAIALAPAAVGGSLEVRLRLGGKVLRAVALGPGRATLSAGAEVKHE